MNPLLWRVLISLNIYNQIRQCPQDLPWMVQYTKCTKHCTWYFINHHILCPPPQSPLRLSDYSLRHAARHTLSAVRSWLTPSGLVDFNPFEFSFQSSLRVGTHRNTTGLILRFYALSQDPLSVSLYDHYNRVKLVPRRLVFDSFLRRTPWPHWF